MYFLMKRKIYACFVDYQKAFDRVKHGQVSKGYEKSWYTGTRNETDRQSLLESICYCKDTKWNIG